MPPQVDTKGTARRARAKPVGAKRPFKYNGEYLYAVTVTPNKRDRDYSRKDIIQNLEKLRRNRLIKNVTRYCFETKKDNTLHMYGIVSAYSPFKYTPKCKGWQWYLKPISSTDDLFQWERYCCKHSEENAQAYYSKYRFDDN